MSHSTRLSRSLLLSVAAFGVAFLSAQELTAQASPPTRSSGGVGPVFEDGQAQVVPEFADPARWIRHDLWVETEFDTDGDGAPDRVHVDVTRQAETEEGMRVAVVYETSPYYSGVGTTAAQYFWNIQQELGAEPSPRG